MLLSGRVGLCGNCDLIAKKQAGIMVLLDNGCLKERLLGSLSVEPFGAGILVLKSFLLLLLFGYYVSCPRPKFSFAMQQKEQGGAKKFFAWVMGLDSTV